MGKWRRSRKQIISIEEEDLAGLEDVSSDDEDNNFGAEDMASNVLSQHDGMASHGFEKKKKGMKKTIGAIVEFTLWLFQKRDIYILEVEIKLTSIFYLRN